MVKLIRVYQGQYRVEEEGKSVEGRWAFVLAYLTHRCHITHEEVEYAITDMYQKHHDTAHFGVNRTFIFSSNTRTVRNLVTELKAILSLRSEFDTEYRLDPASKATRDAWDRLMNLYMTLNVEAVLESVNNDDVNKVAS